MRNAPHIYPHVRDFRTYYDVPEPADPEDNAIEINDADIRTFIHGFTRLDAISRSAFPIFDISDVLPGSSIATLYIGDYSPRPQDLVLLFQASASKIRTLTLNDVRTYSIPPTADTSQMPTITMVALEQLALLGCMERFPFFGKVQMPKLKVLWCDGWYSTLREDLPDSLVTLVVSDAYGTSPLKNYLVNSH